MASSVENICDFKTGAVVLDSNYMTKECKRVDMYGHVLSFSLNCFEDIVIRVQWADGEISTVHPALVHLKDWRK